MGCSSSSPEQPNAVDKELAALQEEQRKHLKVLLLGAGESGKSTFCKQLRIMVRGNQPLLQPREKDLFITAIRRNVIECAVVLADAMNTLGIDFERAAAADAAARLQGLSRAADLTPALAADVTLVWGDGGAQRAWESRSKFWILDAAPYYFTNAARLAEASYEPTEPDIIMARVVSTGVSVVEILAPPMKFSVVDVGGQRNERRKWIHQFDDVKAIVFLASLAGYNQTMYEDEGKIRLQESLELFEQVVSNPLFRRTPIFLVLNKKDLFSAMIVEEKVPLTVCFPDYSGPAGNVEAAQAYVEERYRAALASSCPEKRLHMTAIAARVRHEVEVSWTNIKQVVLKDAGFADSDNVGFPKPGEESLSLTH
ncbi:unnamed protein product [Phaeothamnion confervicola]